MLFAGDRATASKLKALITDDTIVLERKGADAVPWPNSLSVMMTSNEEWVVLAGPESRRFFVLDVSDKRHGDRAYFKALWDEVNDSSARSCMSCSRSTSPLSSTATFPAPTHSETRGNAL